MFTTCRLRLRRVSGLILWSALALPAVAGTEGGPALCERAITRGAASAGIPASVLRAISLTETGRYQGGKLRAWPWAVNLEGKGYWFANRAEALAFAQASLASGHTSFDVGCFQINYRWHGQAFDSLESMFDQDLAGKYAAGFLRDLHAELGDWSAAAGAYHSRTPERAGIYRARFDRILASATGVETAAIDTGVSDVAAPPRKSRERMARRPLIITIEPGQFSPQGAGAPTPHAGERVEQSTGIRVTRGIPEAIRTASR